MGSVLSIPSSAARTARTAIQAAKAVIGVINQLSSDFNAVLDRASRSPGLPVPNPTHPYWLNDPPFPELVDVRSSGSGPGRIADGLPETADVVIIGSGIAGAAVARSLLHERRRWRGEAGSGLSNDDAPLPRVVVLEARQLCSGATARNGGHIKPVPHEFFPIFSRTMPRERAAALTRFQNRHVGVLTGLCDAEDIGAAEARDVETVDLFLDQDTFRGAARDVEQTKEWMPEVEVTVWEADDARKEFSVNDTIAGALSYPAGAIYPYRFVTTIWRRLLDAFPSNLSIETTTPAQSIATTPTPHPSSFPYAVSTPHGKIRTRHVVHATNGFASNLIPGLRRKITGARAHMSAQRPGPRFPDSGGRRSWGVVYEGGFDYVTQRPPTGNGRSERGECCGGDDDDGYGAANEVQVRAQGDLMLGGGFFRSGKRGLDQMGIYDDGPPLDAFTVSHVAGIFPAIFGPESWGPGSEVKSVWSGTLGFTGDLLPFVGRLDEGITGRKAPRTRTTTVERKQKKEESILDEPESGEWIAAGFSGEGMVWAWLCGTAVGVMLAGSGDRDLPEMPGRPGGRVNEWLPKELLVSEERLRSADIVNLTGKF